MSSQPFMQLYVGDYLADTLDLTTEEHGAYLLLLMTMWRHGAELPDEPKKLARIARVTPQRWKKIWGNIGHFFQHENGKLTNNRLQTEYKKAIQLSRSRAENGARGGAAKALKNNKAPVAKATDLPQHSQISEPEPDKYSEPKGSGTASVPVVIQFPEQVADPRKTLFAEGLQAVSEFTGKPPPKCRSLLGRWLQLADDDAAQVLDTIRKAVDYRIAEPVSWIEASLKPKDTDEEIYRGVL